MDIKKMTQAIADGCIYDEYKKLKAQGLVIKPSKSSSDTEWYEYAVNGRTDLYNNRF